ncbi:MAG: GNAT family N-acetyltransferase [Candidatus Omnitrophica bacterium]|nr:GNAT family N-acetyltransferase [Candidatus Omnitrophota bacterium]
MLNINRISDYEEFRDCKAMWDDLFVRSGTDNIFLTFEWIDAYIRHFLKKKGLFILKILDDKRLIGIAPLMIRRYGCFGLPVRVMSFIGTLTSDRMDFIMEGDRKKGIDLVLDYMMDTETKWDIVDLQEITDSTQSTDIINTWLNDRKQKNILGPPKRNFFIDFSGKNGLSCSERFSRRFREKYRRVNNKETGLNLEFENYRNGKIGVERLFSDICMIEGYSWKGRQRKGIFSKPDSKAFHREIFDRFSKKGWIDISIMKSNGTPIAYKYDYFYSQKLYDYNHSFSETSSHLSPGTMLFLWALKGYAEEGILEFDFLRGEEEWKGMLANNFRVHDRIRIFRNTFYSRCLYCLYAKLIPYLKSKKAIRSVWMKIRETLG